VFERLFESPFVLACQQNGPLVEDRRRYLAHCAERQMSRRTLRSIARYTLIAAKLLNLAERSRELVTHAEVKVEVDRWLTRRSRRSTAQQVRLLGVDFAGHVIRWLAFSGRLQPITPTRRPYAREVDQFADYMLRERGLSPETVACRRRVIGRFLAEIDEARLRLDRLTVAQLDELLARKIREGGYARTTIQTLVSALRPFFRFGEQRGWCRPELAAAVMAPRRYRDEGLPIGPSWVDVKRLLVAVEGDRWADVRDRALLMLLAVYGLRAGEVTALCLKDFDWDQESLFIPRGKSGPRNYPLCRPVGAAVLRYLREVRPRSDRREVFLTLVPPYRPLTAKSLGRAVYRRFHALGLVLPHYGAHMLRHACASHLLSQGLSLKEIGDHLGHRSPDATRIYAKVDLAALRTVGAVDLGDLL
jgi:site-specific recombinase XerD